jgi:hypothetical protein
VTDLGRVVGVHGLALQNAPVFRVLPLTAADDPDLFLNKTIYYSLEMYTYVHKRTKEFGSLKNVATLIAKNALPVMIHNTCSEESCQIHTRLITTYVVYVSVYELTEVYIQVVS